MMNLTNKKVLVVGLSKSGLAAVRLLLNKGALVYATELEEMSISLPDVSTELGRHTKGFVVGKDLVILSPGVPPYCPVIGWAREYGIPIISELELASWYAEFPLVAVTGTNGKSTVTSLIEHIFRCSGKSVVACGNIGLPFSEVVLQEERLSLAIVEASSFQLEYAHSFRPEVAVWLNFSCDHLDHHRSMEEYLKAKLNIFKNQEPGDWAVVNPKELDRVKDEVRCKMVKKWGQRPFSQRKNGRCPHFFENISAAIAVAEIYGISSDAIQSAIDTFQPLPHRLQYVTTVGGIDFIDDSKATNIASVTAALDSIGSPIILILGGRDKGGDFTRLSLEKVSSIIAIGEAQDKIWNQLKDTVPVEKILKLDDAVNHAFQIAVPGTTVLLSPGCSSFDMFKDYKERGDVFQKCVLGLDTRKEVCVAEE